MASGAGAGVRTPFNHHAESLKISKNTMERKGSKTAQNFIPSTPKWGSSKEHHKFQGGHVQGGDIDLMSSGHTHIFGAGGSGAPCVTHPGPQRAGALHSKKKREWGRHHDIPKADPPKRPVANWIWEELEKCKAESMPPSRAGLETLEPMRPYTGRSRSEMDRRKSRTKLRHDELKSQAEVMFNEMNLNPRMQTSDSAVFSFIGAGWELHERS